MAELKITREFLPGPAASTLQAGFAQALYQTNDRQELTYENIKRLAAQYHLCLNNDSKTKIDFNRLVLYSYQNKKEELKAKKYSYGIEEKGDENGAPLSLSTDAECTLEDLKSFMDDFNAIFGRDGFASIYCDTHGDKAGIYINGTNGTYVSVLPISTTTPNLPLYLYTSHLILEGCFTLSSFSDSEVQELSKVARQNKVRIDGNTTRSDFKNESGGNGFAILSNGKVAKILRKGDTRTLSETMASSNAAELMNPYNYNNYNAAFVRAWETSGMLIIKHPLNSRSRDQLIGNEADFYPPPLQSDLQEYIITSKQQPSTRCSRQKHPSPKNSRLN